MKEILSFFPYQKVLKHNLQYLLSFQIVEQIISQFLAISDGRILIYFAVVFKKKLVVFGALQLYMNF